MLAIMECSICNLKLTHAHGREATIQTVSLSFFRFPTLTGQLWVLGQMGATRLAFARMPELRFWKLCGSGTGQGFTPRPNREVWAILAVWDDEERARDAIANSRIFQRWQANAKESWTVFLTAASVRGQWSGVEPFRVDSQLATGPVAILTRATIRPGIILKFWGRVPDISAVIGEDPNVIFKIGIGEVPMLHQVTFSIWPDLASMARFARGDGPHAKAIEAVRSEGWFKEELYARFSVLGEVGTWEGTPPLARHLSAA